MKNRLKVKAVNGMTINLPIKQITGIGTKMNDGTYLALEVRGGLSIPVHPDDQGLCLKTLYS